MKKGITRSLWLTGWALLGLSMVFYVTLELSTRWEQARTPGEKNMGVAVLFMIWWIPTFISGAAGLLCLIAWRIHFCLQAFLSPHLELTRYTHFSLLPRSRWRVLYFEARPQALLRCTRRVMNSGPSKNVVLEGDLSQNAASGKPTAFVSTSESALAKSG